MPSRRTPGCPPQVPSDTLGGGVPRPARLVTVTAWYEPIRVIVKLRFKDRGKKPTYHFLGHAISNHRDSPSELHF
jgi:hypothetical protein